jgi:hypothetical protein
MKKHINRYDYFLVGHEDVDKTHSTSDTLPKTSNNVMDYYSTNQLVATNIPSLGELIGRCLANGQKTIQFKLKNIPNGKNPSDIIFRVFKEQYNRFFSMGYNISLHYNNSIMVFDIIIQ